MRSIHLVAGAATILGLFAACGGDDHPTVADDTKGGSGNTGGRNTAGKSPVAAGEGGEAMGGAAGDGGAATAAGGEGGAGPVASGTPPTVSIITPTEVTDPLGGGVFVSDSVDVICKATQADGDDSSPVDPMTVKIAVLDADGAVVAEKDGTLTGKANEYTAAVPLTGVSSGPVSIRCSARSTTFALGTDTVDVLADRGPIVTLVAPAKDTTLALKKTVTFTFTATPTPLKKTGDSQAAVDKVKLTINGIDIPTTVGATPDTYQAVNVDLSALTTKPNGVTDIAVTATNKRSPDAATGRASSTVFVDGTGPVITVASPTATAIVGGIVTTNFTVADAGSEVDDDSIVVTVDTDTHQFNDTPANWTHTDTGYSLKFDSRTFPKSKIQIKISVTAADKLGNSTTSASIPVYLDNVSPQVDLDPLNMRTQNSSAACTPSFDPVGSAAVSDLENKPGYDIFRALVWEKTNEIQDSKTPLYFAGTDTTSVRLYFRNPNDPQSLLINSKTAGTGTCDEIGLTIAAETLPLGALAAGGNPWYTSKDDMLPDPAGCSFNSGSAMPGLMCDSNSDLWQVLKHREYDLDEPAVYAYAPSAGNTASCTGQGWEYRTLADADGWVCFAARAVDRIGNVGVSPPLRVCMDDAAKPGVPPCANSSVAPPTCTDGCTPPARGGGFITRFN